jgi:hypothetical protein
MEVPRLKEVVVLGAWGGGFMDPWIVELQVDEELVKCAEDMA